MMPHSQPHSRVSDRASRFTESVIREMSRMATKYKAVNLAQGFPDFPCPYELKQAASDALFDDVNQYAITWGAKDFRDALADKTKSYLGLTVDPETEMTVTCGATEAMAATMLATLNPGDEVIIFEPYYENYGPDCILCGAVPRYVTLHPSSWTFDEAELKQAFNDNTRAIIINTPHNPTGKIFNRDELEIIAKLCQQWNVLAFTDEIYEHILYDGNQHVAMATIPGMHERTVTINGLSKTYSVTGWRIGTILAPEDINQAIRKVHDFLTVGAPAPLQRAGVVALRMPQTYYTQLAEHYADRRTLMLEALDDANILYFKPEGAYYVFCDISAFGYRTDIEFTNYLLKDIGVAVVPGSSFFSDPALGYKYIRFCFAKNNDTLYAARERLAKVKDTLRLSV